jgi:hypothetical protein
MNPHSPNVINEMPPQAVKAFDAANKAMKAKLAQQAADEQQQSESPTFNPENIMNTHTPQNAAATTNAIDAGLQRVSVRQEIVREFARLCAPLRAFSTVFQNVPLEGTDEIKVPFYPLPTAANSSYDFTTTDGYTFGQATATNAKTITINKRKYQPLDYSSQELARQPYLNTQVLARLAAENLAFQVLQDVLSCVTAANFGPAALIRAAAALNSDDLADLAGACSDANWPVNGRSLIMGTGYDTQLKKDNSVKLALNINGTEVLREGRVPNLAGFDYFTMPNLPTNDEALGGFAVAPGAGAIFFASAPIAPGPGVRRVLSAFETVTDPATGISLVFRQWGDCDKDVTREIVECSYGYAAGNPAALKRITTGALIRGRITCCWSRPMVAKPRSTSASMIPVCLTTLIARSTRPWLRLSVSGVPRRRSGRPNWCSVTFPCRPAGMAFRSMKTCATSCWHAAFRRRRCSSFKITMGTPPSCNSSATCAPGRSASSLAARKRWAPAPTSRSA